MTSTEAFCVIANCLSQVKQIPIFLGRKKRSLDERGHRTHQMATQGLVDLMESDESAPTQVPPHTESTTQVIEFNLNGKNERFIVARQVTVEVLPSEPSDPERDLDIESEPLINSSNSLFDY